MISQSSFLKFIKDDGIPAVKEECCCFKLFLLIISVRIGIVKWNRHVNYVILPNDQSNPSEVYEVLYNCSERPRPGSILDAHERKLHLLCCAYMPADYITTTKVPAKKDHYVPLLSSTKRDNFQCTLPTSFVVQFDYQKELSVSILHQ